jgi:hypothetical protein
MSAFDQKSPRMPARTEATTSTDTNTTTEVIPSTAAGFVTEKCMLTLRKIQQHAARGIAR